MGKYRTDNERALFAADFCRQYGGSWGFESNLACSLILIEMASRKAVNAIKRSGFLDRCWVSYPGGFDDKREVAII